MTLAPFSRAEKVGAFVGAIAGWGAFGSVLGFGLFPFAIGAGLGYWVGHTINPSSATPTNTRTP